MSPTALPVGPDRFFFFSNEGSEPPHVHVEREHRIAKFQLDPVSLLDSGGFSPHECRRIRRLVERHSRELLEAWHGYFAK